MCEVKLMVVQITLNPSAVFLTLFELQLTVKASHVEVLSLSMFVAYEAVLEQRILDLCRKIHIILIM